MGFELRKHVTVTDRVRLAWLVAGEVAVVVGLHALARLDAFRIQWSDLGAWLERSPFEDAVGAGLRVVALGLGYWLLLSTVAYLVATASDRPQLVQAVDWLMLPAIRRLVSRAMAISLAASTVAGPVSPAVANPSATSAAERVLGEVGPEGELRPPATTNPVIGEEGHRWFLAPHLRPPTPESPPSVPPPQAPPATPVARDGAVKRTVTVQRGDHLWSLSEVHLQQVTGRTDLAEHEIARYWVRVVKENRTRIRSGNPDHIYPGEILVLPEVQH